MFCKSIAAAKEKLELFYEQKTKGIIIRARARWHEHGERSRISILII